jgi:hypothetical protein
MKVYLDGTPLTDPGETLGQVLDAARGSAGERLIVEVLADGTPVPAEHIRTPPPDAPYASEMHLTTADPGMMLRFTMQEVADALDRSAAAHEQTAELLQQGDTVNAMQHMGALLEVWGQLTHTVNIVRELTEGSDIAPDAEVAQLNTHLQQLKEALTSEDLSGLADVLAYDMPPLAQAWATRLRTASGEGV